jgi:dTDP-4-amino-4,6-dideoxygalactose transaminase
MSQKISVSQVDIGPEEEALVLRVLRSGQIAQGPMVAELEERFAELSGVRHAVAVSSGTTALVCALQALRELEVLQAGDEVVTSAFTFVATLNAALEGSLVVRFADIGEDFCIDVESVSTQITERTKVIMPVHLYGLPAPMDELEKLAADRDLYVVEDAAQALGATVGSRAVGSFGIGCFSLYATKNITSGEGGMITTDDNEIANMLRLLRNQGMAGRYQYEVAGHNYRMTDLQAAVAVAQLGRYETTVAVRRQNAARLAGMLLDTPGLVVPTDTPGRRSVWHQFTVRVTDEARLDRDGLASALAAAGIGSGVYYPRAVFDYPCFAERPDVVQAPVPNTKLYATQVLSLPIHPGLTESDIDRVGSTIRELLGA